MNVMRKIALASILLLSMGIIAVFGNSVVDLEFLQCLTLHLVTVLAVTNNL